MNRSEKETAVQQLRSDLEPECHLILAEYRGLTVEEMTELRKRVRAAAGTLRVMKNTLVRRAVEGTSKESMKELLSGPNALAFTKEDPLPLVKVIAGATKEHEVIVLKGGVVEGKEVSPEQIMRIAELPSREVLLGKALGSMMSPVQGLVNVLQGVTRNFVGVLEAIRQAKAAG